MFYSQTILGRKGPLGTVWCAAHFQKKLSKAHITSTNISSTVEFILYPEVPIALRMYGHLLLGVVRIYSKQVEYFVQDCNNLRTGILKVFTSANLNLPEDATHAPYHSITLPETFELDAVAFDEDLDLNRFEDTHLKSNEEITLEDQLLTHEDQYIAIFIDEDIGKSSSKLGDVSGLGAMPMDTDADPSNPGGTSHQSQHSSPMNQAGQNRGTVGDGIPQDIPEIEIMRDAFQDHSFENVPIWSDQRNDVMEPDIVLEEQIMKDKETARPVIEEMLASGGHPLPSQQRQEPPSATSADAHEFDHPQISFGHQSPDLALRSTPPPEQPKARGRKRKLHIDDTKIVLSNREMRMTLQNHSKRKKTEAPTSSLDVWKQKKRLRKDRMFFEPLITGLCDDLCNIYNSDFISARFRLAPPQEDHAAPQEDHAEPSGINSLPEPNSNNSHAEPSGNNSPPSGNDLGMEIERLRDNQDLACTSLLSEIMPSPNRFISSPLMSMPSPIRRDDFTPATTVGTESAQTGRTMESGVLPTPDPAASTGHVGSDMETPSTLYEDGLGVEKTVLFDIPEDDNSAGDLGFLEQDDDTPIGLQGTPEVGYLSRNQGGNSEFDSLSARTRAVAQFFKGQSPVTPIPEQTEDLSLNTILEGKNRRICARMFFETLVLKNCGLVDANQNEPYGDITLKVTPKLKEQFSS